MRIAVIAANGRSGQAFVEEALSAGHTVIAGIHGQSFLKPSENLELRDCDATKEEDLEKLIKGADCVASFIGHVKDSAPRVQTEAIKKVIKVCDKLGVKRLVSLTGTGVRFPGDQVTFMDVLLNLSIGIIDPNRVNDGIAHVEELKKSNLDWTVIRVLKLQNVPPKLFTLRPNGPTKLFVGRVEVAKAVMQVISSGGFIKQAPIIGKP